METFNNIYLICYDCGKADTEVHLKIKSDDKIVCFDCFQENYGYTCPYCNLKYNREWKYMEHYDICKIRINKLSN
jgi:hypothetical protein